MLACRFLREFIPIHHYVLHYLMKPAFPESSKLAYEGPTSKKPLAFMHYDSAKMIEHRTMAEHLRFFVAYWHTFRNTLKWCRSCYDDVLEHLDLYEAGDFADFAGHPEISVAWSWIPLWWLCTSPRS